MKHDLFNQPEPEGIKKPKSIDTVLKVYCFKLAFKISCWMSCLVCLYRNREIENKEVDGINVACGHPSNKKYKNVK